MYSPSRCPVDDDQTADDHWPMGWTSRIISMIEPETDTCRKCGQTIHRHPDEMVWRAATYVITEEIL